MESVREATTTDSERILELTREFRSEMAARRGAGLGRTEDAGISDPISGPGDVAELLADPQRTALVASLDGWTAGVAVLHVTDGPGGECRGVIDACYVESGAREVGLGHLLLDRALEWFTEHGCIGVDGTAHPGDREAKSFFESAGFKARLLVMHRPLG